MAKTLIAHPPIYITFLFPFPFMKITTKIKVDDGTSLFFFPSVPLHYTHQLGFLCNKATVPLYSPFTFTTKEQHKKSKKPRSEYISTRALGKRHTAKRVSHSHSYRGEY